ncbi:hypothetical protein J2X20_002818 [Pelomonas saccharophila]|uniref:Uncharacterized protein n=1 Tax=Roseateles saccharophilus TaxID=304 RepID=A0ABU1YMT5_ROSSA|nr:hypothetical protein [Roseateles saccharophilus]MDR7270160.1 hypothetical protein [Roseateles saccharophilus]
MTPAQAQRRETQANDTELSKRTRKLGVLVTSGYRAHVVKRGTLMNIGKLGQFVTHDDAGIAEAIFQATLAQLSQEERYEVSRVAIEPEPARAIAAKVVDSWAYPKSWGKLLEPYYDACQCDALLLVTDGSSENMFSETAPSYGPSFSSKAAVSNSGAAVKSHLRLGLVFMLIDPAAKEVVRRAQQSDVPDYSEEVQKYWPPSETPIPDEYWARLAAYVGTPAKLYQKGLFEVGLRPSCALPYFARSNVAQQRGQEPPVTLPGTDPAKCQPEP